MKLIATNDIKSIIRMVDEDEQEKLLKEFKSSKEEGMIAFTNIGNIFDQDNDESN